MCAQQEALYLISGGAAFGVNPLPHDVGIYATETCRSSNDPLKKFFVY
jgi:hypothetical protein